MKVSDVSLCLIKSIYCITIPRLSRIRSYQTIRTLEQILLRNTRPIQYKYYYIAIAGAHPPELSPEQLEMSSSKICANLGRAMGVVVGCLLGNFFDYF